jgi:hypothetical protein
MCALQRRALKLRAIEERVLKLRALERRTPKIRTIGESPRTSEAGFPQIGII